MNMRREAGSKVDSTELLTVNLKVCKTFFVHYFCTVIILYEIYRFHFDYETIFALNSVDLVLIQLSSYVGNVLPSSFTVTCTSVLSNKCLIDCKKCIKFCLGVSLIF